jgi:APA family basic amino acid/polyamine antiporter
MFQGLIAGGMVLVGSFDQLLTYLGFALGIFPIMAVLGATRLRNGGMAGPGKTVRPAALLFIMASGLMLILSFLERPLESLVAIATLLLGIPLYFFVFQRERK